MTALESYLQSFCRMRGYSVIEAMNELQDAGIISDLCICPADVPSGEEAMRAVAHLRTLPLRHQNPKYHS